MCTESQTFKRNYIINIPLTCDIYANLKKVNLHILKAQAVISEQRVGRVAVSAVIGHQLHSTRCCLVPGRKRHPHLDLVSSSRLRRNWLRVAVSCLAD